MELLSPFISGNVDEKLNLVGKSNNGVTHENYFGAVFTLNSHGFIQ